MDFILCGNDRRLSYLATRLIREGHRVLSYHCVSGAHVVEISSFSEVLSKCRVLLPMRAKEDLIYEALTSLPLSSTVFGPALPEEFAPLLSRRALQWYDLNEDDAYCRENAVYTAEGVLHALLEHSDKALCRMKLALVGSGRVAQACMDLLQKAGAEITLLARSKTARKNAKKRGVCALHLPLQKESEKRELSGIDALINTVPCPALIGEEILSSLPRGSLLLEVASGEDNFKKDAVLRFSHVLLPLPALPGKTSPQSAANTLFYAITKPKKNKGYPT